MATLVNYALTTVADVKESLGIASSDTSKDNLITRKINQATDAIENYCQRRFMLTNYIQEEYKASHIDEIVLKQRPIVIDDNHTFLQEWRTTTFNMGPAADTWETIDTQLSFIDQGAGVVNLLYNALGYWNRYRYTYWAGYAVTQEDLDAGIAGYPNDLVEACNMLACYYVNNPSGTNVYLAGQSEGSRSTRYVLHTNKSFVQLLNELGIDETINAYANNPVLTDR